MISISLHFLSDSGSALGVSRKKIRFLFFSGALLLTIIFSFFSFHYHNVFCSSSDAFLISRNVIDPFYGLFFFSYGTASSMRMDRKA